MSDPRTTPFSGRVAHLSLKGYVDAKRFVEGDRRMVFSMLTPLRRDPAGAIERTLLFGDAFIALDEQGSWVYGFAEKDGYCGWIALPALGDPISVTHFVNARETYQASRPDLKTPGRTVPIHFASKLKVTGFNGQWAEFAFSDRGLTGFVPKAHLRAIDQPDSDPVDVSRRFLGTPYLWGGNSARGIDCSGLVQAAMHACGWACPGDSDLQESMPGKSIDPGEAYRSGDLIFWRGHVAMATGPATMIHANAHHMMVVEEPIEQAVARIAKTDTGLVTLRLRPALAPLVSPF